MIIEIFGAIIVIGIILIIIALAIKTVRPTERGLIERFGKYVRFAEPGIHFLIPFVEKMYFTNVTEQMVDAEPQDIITKDNLNAIVDAQIYFRVRSEEESVKKSQYGVDNYFRQIVAIARTTLRDKIGKTIFIDVNNQREKLNELLETELEKQTQDWGIKVVRAEIKEIEPPKDVQATMNEIIKANNTKTAAVDFAKAKETQADGDRMAAIKMAAGEKQSSILVAEGHAKAIELVNVAGDKYFVGNAQKLESLRVTEQALKNNTKVIVPSNSPLSDFVSAFAAVSETKTEKKKDSGKE